MILASFAEVVSIGAVLPFLGALTSPDRLFELPFAKPFIRAFNFTESRQLLFPLTIGFALAALVSGSMRLVLLWAQTRLSHAIGADFSISIFRRTLYQPYAIHVSRNSSEIIAGISGKANAVVYSTLLPGLTILSSALMLITILMALVVIEPRIALTATAGFGGIYALVMLVTKKRLMRDSQNISRESGKVIKALQEGLGGIRDVLIDGTQATYCKIYSSADLPLRRAHSNIQIIGGSPRYIVEALGMLLIAALAYILARRPEGIASTIPVLGALALGAQRLLPVLQQGYASWSSIRGGQDSLRDALDLLDQPLPIHANERQPKPMVFQYNLVLRDIAFRYKLSGPWVLHGLNLTITKGSRVGFIGSTGCGKSTLLDVVMGLLHPCQGVLLIDGVSVTQQNQRAWLAHIAHVPQTIFLTDATIAENIAFGVPADQINYELVHEAAQKAQIADVIDSWEKRYETFVGERGIRLSGGQRQRIGIARALYKKADVIVFDEATSALDNNTERAVMDALKGLGDEITVLTVAHRLTTLKNCTHVVEMADGSIRRTGSYQEIVSSRIE
jgi:ABC-type bacteriocin/lantibiotic exporter with double-glycine peptidase domain